MHTISVDIENARSEFLAGNDPATTFTENTMSQFRISHGLPRDGVVLPLPSQRPHHEIAGMVAMYEIDFELGLKLPLSNFLTDVLESYNFAPGQLAPNSWRILLMLHSLGSEKNIGVSLGVLHHVYHPKGQLGVEKGRIMFSLRVLQDPLVGLNGRSDELSWKGRYFLVKRSLVFVPTYPGSACSSWRNYGIFHS